MEINSNDIETTKKEFPQIERILADRVRNRSTEYLVKWKKLPHSENSWIDEIQLIEHEDIVSEYLKNKNELIKIRKDFPKNALRPHKIIDAHRSNKKVYYVVRYEDNGSIEEIEAKDMHKIDPMECIEFLEQQICQKKLY